MGLFRKNKTVKIEPDISYVNETAVTHQSTNEPFAPFFDPKKGRNDPIINYKFHPETLDDRLTKINDDEPFKVYKTDILTLDIMNNELNAKLDYNVNSFYKLHKETKMYNDPQAYDLEDRKAKVKEHEIQKEIRDHIDNVRNLDKEYMGNYKSKHNKTLVFNPTQKLELSGDERIRLAERRLSKVQDNYIPLEKLERTATLKLPVTNYSKFNKWIREESALYSKKAPGTKSFLSTNNKRIKSYNAIPIAQQKIRNLEINRNNSILDKTYKSLPDDRYLTRFDKIDVYKNNSPVKEDVYKKVDSILGKSDVRRSIEDRLSNQLRNITSVDKNISNHNSENVINEHPSYERESLFNNNSSSLKTKYFGNNLKSDNDKYSVDTPRTLKVEYKNNIENYNIVSPSSPYNNTHGAPENQYLDSLIEPTPEIFKPHAEILNISNNEIILAKEEMNYEIEKINVEMKSVRNILKTLADSGDEITSNALQAEMPEITPFDLDEETPVNEEISPNGVNFTIIDPPTEPLSISTPISQAVSPTYKIIPPPHEDHSPDAYQNIKLRHFTKHEEDSPTLKIIPPPQGTGLLDSYQNTNPRNFTKYNNNSNNIKSPYSVSNEVNSILGNLKGTTEITSALGLHNESNNVKLANRDITRTLGFSNRSKNKVNLLSREDIKKIRERDNKSWDKYKNSSDEIRDIQRIKEPYMTNSEVDKIKVQANAFANDEINNIRKLDTNIYLNSSSPIIQPIAAPKKDNEHVIKSESKTYNDPSIRKNNNVVYINKNSVAHNSNIILSDFSFGDDHNISTSELEEKQNKYYENHQNIMERDFASKDNQENEPNVKWYKFSTNRLVDDRNDNDPMPPDKLDTKQPIFNHPGKTIEQSNTRDRNIYNYKPLESLGDESPKTTYSNNNYNTDYKPEGDSGIVKTTITLEEAPTSEEEAAQKHLERIRQIELEENKANPSVEKIDFNDYRRELHSKHEANETNAFSAKTSADNSLNKFNLDDNMTNSAILDETKVLDFDLTSSDLNGIPKKKLVNNLDFSKTQVVDLYETADPESTDLKNNSNLKKLFKKRTSNLENSEDVFKVNDDFSKNKK